MPSGYYPFNDALTDASGNSRSAFAGASGTPAYVAGKFNNALLFSGSATKINDLLSGSVGQGTWSISFWVKDDADPNGTIIRMGPNPPSVNFELVFAAGAGSGSDNYYSILMPGFAFFSATIAQTGSWRNVILTNNAGSAKLYVDGSQVASASGPAGATFDGTDLWEISPTAGGIDDLAVWSVLLTAPQIAEIASGVAPIGDIMADAPVNSVAPSCSPTSGTTEDTFEFDSGTWQNTPTSWSWEYRTAGSGSWTEFSTDENPSILGSVFGVGEWDTRLTATNAGGSSSPATGDTITVASAVSAPVASFTSSPENGTAPLSVTFTDTSTNDPTEWLWEYSQADTWQTFSRSKNPTRTFTAGTWNVRLTATNSAGSNTVTRTGCVPVAAQSMPPSSLGFMGL